MQFSPFEPERSPGFTLIELSIVLVIIGLITGGILVGRDLIDAAALRATVAQIEKYNTAVNTFRIKYGQLPGDMDLNTAKAFGFLTTNRGSVGNGDNDGAIDGGVAGHSGMLGYVQPGNGEAGVFWVDLSFANLIPGNFNTAIFGTQSPSASGASLSLYFPSTQLGGGNMIYVYESGGYNYYGLSSVTSLANGFGMQSTGSLTPLQAVNIDKKIDDGVATTGTVRANYVLGNGNWSIAEDINPLPLADIQSSNAVSGSYTSATCFDTTTGDYATNYNGGLNQACGLSFRFQ
jgi:prepilin-type N-terminal cleavage/methylation domain-containing protein